jgi:hypothetical protein
MKSQEANTSVSAIQDATVKTAIAKAHWRRTKSGLLSVKYSNMLQRVKGEHRARYTGLALLPRTEFIQFALNDSNFNELFDQWHANGYTYKLTPSVDRVDNTGGYTRDNIRFVTHGDNARHAMIEIWQERKASTGPGSEKEDAALVPILV